MYEHDCFPVHLDASVELQSSAGAQKRHCCGLRAIAGAGYAQAGCRRSDTGGLSQNGNAGNYARLVVKRSKHAQTGLHDAYYSHPPQEDDGLGADLLDVQSVLAPRAVPPYFFEI